MTCCNSPMQRRDHPTLALWVCDGRYGCGRKIGMSFEAMMAAVEARPARTLGMATTLAVERIIKRHAARDRAA